MLVVCGTVFTLALNRRDGVDSQADCWHHDEENGNDCHNLEKRKCSTCCFFLNWLDFKLWRRSAVSRKWGGKSVRMGRRHFLKDNNSHSGVSYFLERCYLIVSCPWTLQRRIYAQGHFTHAAEALIVRKLLLYEVLSVCRLLLLFSGHLNIF